MSPLTATRLMPSCSLTALIYHHDQQQHRAMQLHHLVSFASRHLNDSLVSDCRLTAAAARLVAATARSNYHAQLHLPCRVYKHVIRLM